MAERPMLVARDDQERVLLDYVERLERFREGRRAVHVHLSRLKPYHRREHHLRVAAAVFDPLIKKFEGGLFRLLGGDHVFLTRGATAGELDSAVLRLRFLFGDDPLLAGPEGEDLFCTRYDLERDYDALRVAVRDLAARGAAPLAASDGPGGATAASPKRRSQPLDARHLAEVERVLTSADLTNLARRQPVCLLVPGRPPELLFHEVYVSIAQLRETVLPDFDLAADRWLFQHLTQTLDLRMLALLMRPDAPIPPGGFSLNLNLDTVLAPEFLQFDAAMRSRSRGPITIELQQIDVFGDMITYRFARNFLKDRGYRLCLDGADPMTLQLVGSGRLGLDLVKLRWEKGMTEDVMSGRGADLAPVIAAIGRDRVIICRCESEDGVRLGQSLGVAMFQGHHIDALWQQAGTGRRVGT